MQGGEIFGKVSRFFEKYDEIVAAAGGGKSRTQALDRSKNLNAVPVSLGELELERKAALEEYMAMCADCDADVYRFRNKVLEGEPLAQDQARELLKSPAAATLETRIFKVADIPVVGHTAKMTSFERELLPHGASHVATLTVDPPGITREVPTFPLPGTPNAGERSLVVLEFPDEEGRIAGREVWGISLLGELKKVSEKLSERYRWQPAQAAWFVLTGEIPAVPTLTVTRSFASSMYHSDALITVEATRWVSSRTVELAFRYAQVKTLGSGGGRRPGEKNLKLLRFVIERTEPLGKLEGGKRSPRAAEHMTELELVTNLKYTKMPKGKDLVSEWNATYPQWSYGDDTRRFWRDYKRNRESVALALPTNRSMQQPIASTT